MRDTIYSIDTVYIQNKLDSISQLDMGQHINTIHSTYDSYMSLLLWLFGLGITIVLGVLPYYAKRKRDKEFKEQDRKYKEKLDSLKSELIIEMKIENKKKLKKKTKKLTRKIDKELEKIDLESKVIDFYHQGINSRNNGYFETSINCFLVSVIYSVRIDDMNTIVNVKKQLNEYIELEIVVNENQISPFNNLTYKEYIKKILEISSDNNALLIIVKQFLKLLENVIDLNNSQKSKVDFKDKTLYNESSTENPPQGSD